MRIFKNTGRKKWDIDLTCPESWLLKLPLKSSRSFGCLCTFFLLGGLFQYKYPFPCFYTFTALFLIICSLCFIAEKRYCEVMREVSTVLLPQKCASSANVFITTWGTRSPIFVAGPLATVLIFGVGGCSMFGAIRLIPTLIWVLMLFTVTVAISIVGYVQYICLAIYIAKLAHSGGLYKALEKEATSYIPADISWIQKITKLSHMYRTVFFTVGCAYIVAFAGFCFWPEMVADISSLSFYILWGIIFAAIVMAFPIISALEYKWIKQIIQILKESYIYDLEQEQLMLRKVQSEQLISMVVSINVRQILDSKDYPLHSVWSTGYAMLISAINFLTTATTVFTDTLPFISDLRRFF